MGTEDQTTQGSTFRAEALAHRNQKQGPGELIKLSPGWTNWAFFLILGLFVAAVTAASLIEIDRYAQGATSIAGGRVVVLVPAAQASEIAAGNRVEIGPGAKAEVVSFEDTVLYPTDVKDRYGIDVSVPSVAVVTSATEAKGAAGIARVLVESQPMIVALVPGLSALFGGPGG